ncbi:YitT family protein [Fictibacillus sp. NPDC058756]|uniref:YitT family protein n=1 Tax=Fictibacillus sp. NPDC058756 TaxID=3346625 RepID=UPI0036BF830A
MHKVIWLTIGAFLQGLAMAVFLFPHAVPSGGVAGIAILNDFFFQIPLGMTLWIINFGLLLLAVKKLGKQAALWTIYCVAVTSITVDWLASLIQNSVNNILFDVIYGALIFGIGVGILFRYGASSGGMDILALIIAKWTGKKPGIILFWINSIVLLFTAINVGASIILFAVLCQWISTKIIDYVRTAQFQKKAKQYM